MSTIFEAFVFCGEIEQATAFLDEHNIFDFPVEHLEVEEDTNVFYINNPTTLEPEIIENIAKEIAQEFSQCLYVCYNDEDNTSYSMIYDENGFIDMFGEEDEVWVEVDETGYPNTKGQRYTKQEVVENQSSEKPLACIFSSIDAGLLRLDPYTGLRGQALVNLAEDDEDDLDDEDGLDDEENE